MPQNRPGLYSPGGFAVILGRPPTWEAKPEAMLPSPTPHRRCHAPFAAVALALAPCLAPVNARAQVPASAVTGDTLKRAREQFSQALALQTAGDWAGALALLKEVAAIKPTPQVRFNVALCEEELGQLVAALGDYQLAAADARAERADQVADEVARRLDALELRIPRLTVTRGKGAEAASVALDGVSLGDAVIGQPMPTDPGPHTIEAKAPGYRPFRQTLRLAEQQSQSVEITLEADPAASLPQRVQPAAVPRRPPTYAYVIGGVGLASLGASGVFFGLRAGKISKLDHACPGLVCPQGYESDIKAGKLYTTIAEVTLAVGAAAVVTGVVLILAGSSRSEPSVALAPAGAGAQLFGRF